MYVCGAVVHLTSPCVACRALAGAESPLLNITAEELMATQNDHEARGASPGGSQRAQNAALG